MILTELIAEIQALTGRDEDTVLVTDERIVRWLNEAQIHIVKKCVGHIDLETKHVTAIALEDGVYSYGFEGVTPTVFHLLEAYYLDGVLSRRMGYVETDTFDKAYPSPADCADGIPQEWTRRGYAIEVYPVPTASESGKYIRLDYTKRPTAFSISSLEAACDMSDADQGLIYYAASEAFKAIGSKQSESDTYMQYFLSWLEDYRQQKDGFNSLNR